MSIAARKGEQMKTSEGNENTEEEAEEEERTHRKDHENKSWDRAVGSNKVTGDEEGDK